MSRLKEGDEANGNIEQISAVEDTNTTNWPEQYVKFYITNYAVSTENEQCFVSLNSEIHTINAKL